jgi:hypothetical protein
VLKDNSGITLSDWRSGLGTYIRQGWNE